MTLCRFAVVGLDDTAELLLTSNNATQKTFDRILAKVNLSKLGVEEASDRALVLSGIASRLLHTANRDALDHVKGEIVSLLKLRQLQASDVRKAPQGLDAFTAVVEMALNIALAEETPEKRASAFAETLVRLHEACPEIRQLADTIASRLCEELPATYAQHFWRIRTQERMRQRNE